MLKEGVRLNKYISESGLCSRREADKFIEKGVVYINGRKAVIGDQVKPGDRVRVNGNELEPMEGDSIVLIALNKPVGVTSTTEQGVRDNIVQYVNHSKRIFPVGRLDKDSQGLILLTNDGDIVNKILRAGNRHEKEYLVTVNKALTPEVISGMANGVPMLGMMTRKCKVFQESSNVFRIILVQGLNRQIRRMCEHFGYEVTKLERIRIMHIQLKGLPLGEWRDLTDQEKSVLYETLENSSDQDLKHKGTKKPEKPQKTTKAKTDNPRPSNPSVKKSSHGKSGHKHKSHPPRNGGKSSNKSGRRR